MFFFPTLQARVCVSVRESIHCVCKRNMDPNQYRIQKDPFFNAKFHTNPKHARAKQSNCV